MLLRAASLQVIHKLGFDILRQRYAAYNLWPKLKRWRNDQGLINRDLVQVVVQKGAAPTMPRVARHADSRTAVAPMTGAADVISGQISEKDVCALIPTLGATLQFSACGRQRSEIGIGVDRDQQVGIFRIVLVFRQRADKRNASDAREGVRALHETQYLMEQEAAD